MLGHKAHQILTGTLDLFEQTRVSYPGFFRMLTQQFAFDWRSDRKLILASTLKNSDPNAALMLERWRKTYQSCLAQLPQESMAAIQQCLQDTNPMTVPLRPEIEAVWAPIAERDDWQPFYDLISQF